MSESPEVPVLIQGGLAADDRGELCFINEFDMSAVRRFYSVTNHQSGFVRAWHAHRRESKYVYAACGAALIAAVKIDDWDAPSREAKVHRFVLSAHRPAVVYIPAGYANGFKTLTPNAILIFFSTSTLQDSLGDDVRFSYDYWNPWSIEQR